MKSILRGCVLALTATLTAGEVTPVWTEAQLEADWLVQARLSPENLQALATQDAAGVVDGVKSGQPDHRTKSETWTWWQVDLGAASPLDRVEVFNPAGNFGRQAWFKVLVSADGKDFAEIHCLEGPTWPRDRRLAVKLDGRAARWVRISAGGRDSLRLSEVEVYAVADPTLNIALKKPATQSSFAKWRKPDTSLPPDAEANQSNPLALVPVAETITRGLALATSLDGQKVDTAKTRAELVEIGQRWSALPADTPVAGRLPLYYAARRSVRALALNHPLLASCDRILFLKRRPQQMTCMHQQFHGWYSSPGGGIWCLEGLRSGTPTLRHLTPGLPPGDIQGLELSYDGRRVLFAYAQHFPEVLKAKKTVKEQLPEASFYHLHELDLASGAIRQLTHGRYDDMQASYLPGGDIVFMSTRRGTFVQVTQETARRTTEETLPDSFIRCGGEAVRNQTLHRMAGDGSRLRTLSPFETPEWYTALDHDGRILYARWDYVDRDARIAMNLWSCNPDGTNPSIVFGNHTRSPYCAFEARPVPGSRAIVFTGSPHHGQTGGPLLLLDPAVDIDGQAPLTSLTPEVCCPESDGFPRTYYQAPWPLSREVYLCAWSPRPQYINNISYTMPTNSYADLGLYYYDAFGNRELLHRDPAICSTTPVPWVPRQPPPERAELPPSNDPVPSGRFLISDVYQGLTGIPRGAAKRLRIVGVPPKVQPSWGVPALGLTSYDAGKFVLGTVPIDEDGSAYFVAPAGVNIFFQVLAADGRAIQTMRSATYLQGGQTLSCTGCHEPRNQAPPNAWPYASQRVPSRIRPDVEGSWPYRFDRLMKPMLDRLAAANDPKLAALQTAYTNAWELVEGRGKGQYFIPIPAVPRIWVALADYGGKDSNLTEQQLNMLAQRHTTASRYAMSTTLWATERQLDMLTQRNDKDWSLRTLLREQDIAAASPVGRCMATISPLWDLFTAPQGEALTADERARLALWLDTYGQVQGHFSPEQEAEIAALRERWKDLLEPLPITIALQESPR
jgi:hypothetical protein